MYGNIKILVSGNPNENLAKGINSVIPNCEFKSRSNVYDLTDKNTKEKFAQESLNFDHVILCSALWQFHQSLLLNLVHTTCQKNHKKGKIIVLGSSIDRVSKGTDWLYPIEKKPLRNIVNI